MKEYNSVAAVELYEVSISYTNPLEWTTGGHETCADYLVLKLVSEGGLAGAAEIVCKPAWNGMTPGVLGKIVIDIVWPVLRLRGLGDKMAGSKIGRAIRDVGALTCLLDNACRDLWAAPELAAEGANGSRPIPAAAVLTRASPKLMADQARHAVEVKGYRSLKVKLGQGLDEDAKVLAAIRSAAGESVSLTGDANSAYGEADLSDLMSLAEGAGLAFIEDPCPIYPHEMWRQQLAEAPVPILIDRNCVSAVTAQTFAELGATHFSAKPGRIGVSEAEAIMTCAQGARGQVCIGMFGESTAGAVNQMRLASSHVDAPFLLASEIGFHEALADDYLQQPLVFEDGGFVMPQGGNLAALIDWPKVKAASTQYVVLRS